MAARISPSRSSRISWRPNNHAARKKPPKKNSRTRYRKPAIQSLAPPMRTCDKPKQPNKKMAKVSFSKSGVTPAKPDSPAESETQQCTAVAERPDMAVGPAEKFFEDDVDASEIKVPTLNIVQKVGPLSDAFTSGDIVLNKELVIYGLKPEKPALEATVLGIRPT